MGYRQWPAVLVVASSLAGASLVVGEHVVDAADRCLDSAGWFTATLATDPADSHGGAGPAVSAHPRLVWNTPGRNTNGVVQSGDDEPNLKPNQEPASAGPAGRDQVSGCLDVDRIEIPAPAPDDRA